MTSLLNHSSEPTTTQNDSGILVSTYLMNQLVWSILGALLCFVFQDIYNHRKCFLASLTQLAVEVVIAVALSLGVIAVGNNWLSFCIGLLFYTWFHRPSNLFGGLRRSVKRVFCTAAVLVIVTVLGTLWMLWCLVVHLINLVEMFRLPVALVLLTLGTVCEHAPLILRLLAFVICLYLSFLIKRAPVENRRGATSPIVHQGMFLFERINV